MRALRGLPRRLPAAIAGSLGVLPGEKVIAWGSSGAADAGELRYAVATDRALYLQSPGARVPWHRVSKASWDEPTLVLVLVEGDDRSVLRVRLDDARDLPPAVHDRVTDSIIVSERVELTATAGARMVARRDSDDGSVHWSVVFDPGLDPQDLSLRPAVDEALGRLRDALGI